MHVFALELGREMSSGHRVKRSMIIKRYDIPLLGGNGPTRSTCRLLTQPNIDSL